MILAAGLMGIKKYAELYERKRILQTIRNGAEKIKNNLRCMCMPLYECFLNADDFFKEAGELIGKGEFPSEAVRNTVFMYHCLKKEDRDIIFRFADGLTAQDCSGQIANVELFLKEIEGSINNASAELNTKGTLFVKGSLLISAAMVLLLI